MFRLKDILANAEEPQDFGADITITDLPIPTPEGFDWTERQNPKRLTKIFKFSSEGSFNSFVMDVLEHQSETGHHGRITIQYPQVKIEVWTHTLNDITDVDFEWAQAINEIGEGYSV